MFHSGEVRWFFRGDTPSSVRDWFENSGCGRLEAPRVDDYLLLPHCCTTSVKFRDGRLEIKAQTGAPEIVGYDNGVAGLRDTWVKWPGMFVDPARLRDVFERDREHWVSVEKSRYLRLVSLVEPDPEEIAPGSDPLPRGCQVELTDIRTWPGKADERLAVPWWSLSFEAFGDPELLVEDVDRAVRFFFEAPPPVPLESEASMSYPVWLNATGRSGT